VSDTQDLVLELKGLKTNFYTYEGIVKALDGVDLFLRRGDTMGLVGETGCGKSVTARSILRLVEPPGKIEEGQMLFHYTDPDTGEIELIDIMDMSEQEVLETRGASIAIVFQDPATYPNPVFRVGDQIAEVILLHQDLRTDVLDLKIETLEDTLKEDIDPEKRTKIEEKISYYKSQYDDPPEPDDKDGEDASCCVCCQSISS
jgi:ABC-type dipeptide/oligopeptide/nickel transport system ATPase component